MNKIQEGVQRVAGGNVWVHGLVVVVVVVVEVVDEWRGARGNPST
jgi:hypothetical protein